jgi:hypothetical protein
MENMMFIVDGSCDKCKKKPAMVYHIDTNEKYCNPCSHYYGSDFNKFVDRDCSHEMTCINMDCLMIKVADHKVRVIESKHNKELTPVSQDTALSILDEVFRYSNGTKYKGECYKVVGDYPYTNGAKIYRYRDDLSRNLHEKQSLMDWVNFKKDLEIFP